MAGFKNINISKIDSLAVDGLLGVEDSLAYKVHEIEKHLHNDEDWFGAALIPVGETHIADDVTVGSRAPFQVDAGNDDWGAWVQILGSDDTPNRNGMAKFDLHKIQVVDSETTNVHAFIQIACGASGAAGLSAGTYTTIPYLTPTNQAAEGAIGFKAVRCDVGTKVWARCMGIGEAGGLELDFYFGLHEYIG